MGQGFGIFGKIPSLGDFLRLGLPDGFAKIWDDWLQTEITAAKAAWTGDWDDVYLSAPIWRFTLPPGQAGAQAVSGILMASVDRVGRQFPLTIVAAHGGDDLALIHFANRAIFEHLEDVALAALDQDTGRDDLAASLAVVGVRTLKKGIFAPRRYVGQTPPEVTLAAKAMGGDNLGIWTCALPDDHRMMQCAGLPRGEDMRAMLNPAAADWVLAVPEVAQ